MVEQQRLGEHLQQIDQVAVAADVRHLARPYNSTPIDHTASAQSRASEIQDPGVRTAGAAAPTAEPKKKACPRAPETAAPPPYRSAHVASGSSTSTSTANPAQQAA